jgi:hypothetical protein
MKMVPVAGRSVAVYYITKQFPVNAI